MSNGPKENAPTGPQTVLFAAAGEEGITVGVVTNSEPSSLALLAAGVAGMAARRARREKRIEFLQSQKTQT